MKNKKVLVGIIAISLILLSFFIMNKSNEPKRQAIKFGVSEGVPSFVANKLLSYYKEGELKIEHIEIYSFQDCWNNSTQLALSSDAIDLAILCTSKAKEFVKKDERFEMMNSSFLNTNVIVIKDNKPKKIAVSIGREEEITMIRDLLGDECEIVEMSPRVLPYALEKGEVQGIVIDYLKSLDLNGQVIFPKNNKDYNTFSLVGKKEFIKSNEFNKFKVYYNEAVTFFMKDYNLIKTLEKEKGKAYLDERRRAQWQKLKMKIQALEE